MRGGARARDRRAGGVVVERGADGLELVPLRAEWRPDRVEPAATVIVLTKAPDTESALAGLEHLRDGIELAGLAPERRREGRRPRALVWRRGVVGGVSMVGGTLARAWPGRPHLRRRDDPRRAAARQERARRAARARSRGGRHAGGQRRRARRRVGEARPRLADHGGARARRVCPSTRASTSEPLAALYVTLVREGIAIAAAEGIEVDDGPVGYPLRQIASAPDDEAVALVRERGRALEAAGMTEIRVSMLQSIERGRRTEVDAIHGFLVREAARLGVDGPATTLCHRLLAGDRTRRARSRVSVRAHGDERRPGHAARARGPSASATGPYLSFALDDRDVTFAEAAERGGPLARRASPALGVAPRRPRPADAAQPGRVRPRLVRRGDARRRATCRSTSTTAASSSSTSRPPRAPA